MILKNTLLKALLVVTVVVSASAEELFLDVTAMKPVPPSHVKGAILSGIGPHGSEKPPELLPLQITVQDMSEVRASHVDGARLNTIITVRNTGAKPVEFPWTNDYRLLDSDSNSASVALGLIVQASAKVYTTDYVNLYGSRSVPGSLVQLDPGQSLKIRVSFRLPFLGLANAKKSSAELSIHATLMFIGGPLLDLAGVTSDDALSVTVHAQVPATEKANQ
jgi:hypothetical protein